MRFPPNGPNACLSCRPAAGQQHVQPSSPRVLLAGGCAGVGRALDFLRRTGRALSEANHPFSGRQRPSCAGLNPHHANRRGNAATPQTRLFPQACVNPGSFPRTFGTPLQVVGATTTVDKSTGSNPDPRREFSTGRLAQRSDSSTPCPRRAFKGLRVAERYCVSESNGDTFFQGWPGSCHPAAIGASLFHPFFESWGTSATCTQLLR